MSGAAHGSHLKEAEQKNSGASCLFEVASMFPAAPSQIQSFFVFF